MLYFIGRAIFGLIAGFLTYKLLNNLNVFLRFMISIIAIIVVIALIPLFFT